MKTHARVVVIGGGVVGVSTLYHLARKGWSDVVLCERTELTAGSTWHAAGLLPLFNMSYSVGQIHKYSVRLYPELERETGQDVGFRPVGNIRLATNRDRMDEYRFHAGVARTIGVRVEFLTPSEVRAIWPLCEVAGLVGAIVHPEDGYIQPADLTQAFARGARDRGAEIYRRTKVTAIERTAGGSWRLRTDQGDIVCEHVVSATGNHARQTGAMVGLDIPTIPIEHQYLVTEPHPDIVARHEQGLPEMGVLRESDASYYLREERGGLLLGPYEAGAPACFVDGPPDDFENDLFPENLERLEPHIEAVVRRVPAFGEVGLKQAVNGPIPYTPDGSPLIGPAWDVPNFWLNEGHSFGVTAAGGAGWQIAEWIVEGEPSIDMMGVDPRRFGPYATRGYLKEKNEEAYANVFTIHYPDEERPAARPLKQAPLLLPHEVAGGGVRPGLRLGAPQLVRAGRRGAAGRVELPPHQLLRARGGRVPPRARARGAPRHERVREVRGVRTGRRSVARRPVREPYSHPGRPHRALPPPRRQRRGALGVHGVPRGPRTLLPRVGRGIRAPRLRYPPKAPSVRWRGPLRALHHPLRGVRDRRPEGARAPQRGDRRLPRRSGLPVALRAHHRRRRRPRKGPPSQLRRRARMGAAPPHRDAELPLRPADGGGPGPRPPAVRDPGDGLPSHREVLPAHSPRALHRVRGPRIGASPFRAPQQGFVHRPRRPRRMAAAGLLPRLRDLGGARGHRTPMPAGPSRSTRAASSPGGRRAGATDGGSARASPSRWCARTSPSRERRSRSRFSASAGGPR